MCLICVYIFVEYVGFVFNMFLVNVIYIYMYLCTNVFNICFQCLNTFLIHVSLILLRFPFCRGYDSHNDSFAIPVPIVLSP